MTLILRAFVKAVVYNCGNKLLLDGTETPSICDILLDYIVDPILNCLELDKFSVDGKRDPTI